MSLDSHDIIALMRLGVKTLLAKPRAKYVLVVLVAVAALVVLVAARSAGNSKEADYFRSQLEVIKASTAAIQEVTTVEVTESLQADNIDSYQESLVEGYSACKQIEGYAQSANKQALTPYSDKIGQLKQFCHDYENVVDYALQISKALEPILTYPAGSSGLESVLRYAKQDLRELNSHPLKDPALEEIVIGLDRLESAPVNPAKLEKQKQHFVAARNYYWNNTVRINSLNRSIDRLLGLFANP